MHKGFSYPFGPECAFFFLCQRVCQRVCVSTGTVLFDTFLMAQGEVRIVIFFVTLGTVLAVIFLAIK